MEANNGFVIARYGLPICIKVDESLRIGRARAGDRKQDQAIEIAMHFLIVEGPPAGLSRGVGICLKL
jgi:hypothetical protein